MHLRQTFEQAVSVLAWLHMGTDLGAVCDLNTTYGCVKAALEWDCKRAVQFGWNRGVSNASSHLFGVELFCLPETVISGIWHTP